MTQRAPSPARQPETKPPAEPPFEIPDGLTQRRAERALLLLLEVSGPGSGSPRRATLGDWERLHIHSGLKPETLRTSWARAKSDLVKLGAPVRRERNGRRVQFLILPGAWEFAHRALGALARAYPPRARKAPYQRNYAAAYRRADQRRERRKQVRRLREEDSLSIREIARTLEVSVGTVHADLEDLRRSQESLRAWNADYARGCEADEMDEWDDESQVADPERDFDAYLDGLSQSA